jgi:hypothetical protein
MRRAILVVLIFCALTGSAHAQAWVPAQGEGAIAIQWQNAFSRDHFFPIIRFDIGHIQTNALVFDGTYGLTDKVAVDVSLPYIASKYNGPQPHPTQLDDGTYHGTVQDFRVALRYNVRAGRFAVTPYVGTILPSHAYEFYAHAAPGRRIREVQVGAYVARLLDNLIPGGFLQARLAYGFQQPVANIDHGRAMGDLEIGDFITERLRVFALGSGQLTHGGVDIPIMGPGGMAMSLQPFHDRIDRTHFLNVGGGAAFALRDSVDLFGSMVTSVANRNGHALNRGIDIGVSWSFKRGGGASARDRARAAAETDRVAEARALVKCVCQRGDR